MAKRQYDNDLPSVTTILGVLRKIGLEMWFKKNTPEFINEASERGKKIGIEIHEAIQSHIEDGKVKIETQYGEEVGNALKSFQLFREEHPEIKLKRAEMVLINLIHGYNGTMDVEGKISNRIVPGDWKTGECKEKERPTIYPEYVGQVAAYLKSYNEVKNKNAKEAFIAVFAKDKVAYNYLLITEEEINDAFDNYFLPCLTIYQYQKRRK